MTYPSIQVQYLSVWIVVRDLALAEPLCSSSLDLDVEHQPKPIGTMNLQTHFHKYYCMQHSLTYEPRVQYRTVHFHPHQPITHINKIPPTIIEKHLSNEPQPSPNFPNSLQVINP
jgi:hypothetical protein